MENEAFEREEKLKQEESVSNEKRREEKEKTKHGVLYAVFGFFKTSEYSKHYRRLKGGYSRGILLNVVEIVSPKGLRRTKSKYD